MKRSMNWMTLTVTCLALCALAATAPAQEPTLDLVLSDVQVLVFPDKSNTFQILPTITLNNFGDLAPHLVQVAMDYADVAQVLINDGITWIDEENNCSQQSMLNCGNGTCADIVSALGWMDGFCTSRGGYPPCGCSYIAHREFEPVPYMLGYNTVVITLDPDDLIDETDETNNVMTIDLGTVANDFVTWSALKDMYR